MGQFFVFDQHLLKEQGLDLVEIFNVRQVFGIKGGNFNFDT